MLSTATRAVVFDLDDTLYLERDFVKTGFAAVGEWCRINLKLPDFTQRANEIFDSGTHNNRVFNHVLSTYAIEADASLVRKLIEVYREHCPNISLLDDARTCLHTLSGHLHLGLITDGFSITQRNKIHALGIKRLFDIIIVTGELGPEFGKPHPLAFVELASHLGLQNEQLVYVADNATKDFVAPHNLGWQTVCIKRKNGIYSDATIGPDVDILIGDLIELLRILPQMSATPVGINSSMETSSTKSDSSASLINRGIHA
jgi:putative hydrolase of the HAD superfamily